MGDGGVECGGSCLFIGLYCSLILREGEKIEVYTIKWQ